MRPQPAFRRGSDVKALRESLKLTQQEFAAKVEKSVGTISLWERAEELNPRTIKEITKAVTHLGSDPARSQSEKPRHDPLSAIGAIYGSMPDDQRKLVRPMLDLYDKMSP